jgi:hypothetical protein
MIGDADQYLQVRDWDIPTLTPNVNVFGNQLAR